MRKVLSFSEFIYYVYNTFEIIGEAIKHGMAYSPILVQFSLGGMFIFFMVYIKKHGVVSLLPSKLIKPHLNGANYTKAGMADIASLPIIRQHLPVKTEGATPKVDDIIWRQYCYMKIGLKSAEIGVIERVSASRIQQNRKAVLMLVRMGILPELNF
jgi:hypothetical protein